jgi:hypothetical protein
MKTLLKIIILEICIQIFFDTLYKNIKTNFVGVYTDAEEYDEDDDDDYIDAVEIYKKYILRRQKDG